MESNIFFCVAHVITNNIVLNIPPKPGIKANGFGGKSMETNSKRKLADKCKYLKEMVNTNVNTRKQYEKRCFPKRL